MATTYKVLGQSAPNATTNTDIYTVPVGTTAVCSTLAVCNQGASTTYRVAVRPSGTSIAKQHYIVYDNYIEQYDTMFLTLAITLAATDVVTVYVGSATVSFSLFGTEIT